MKRIIKFILGLGLLGLGVGSSILLFKTRPVAEKKSETRAAPVVQVMPVTFQASRVMLPSQGLVEARQRTRLAAEVGGRIVKVAPGFDAGSAFAEGEPLLWIDPSDFEAAVARAEANLADAKLALANESAKAEQAKRDWEALRMKGQASDLTLRLPQLASAEAKVKADEASLAKARRDLERTEVRAPFAGRLASVAAEVGTYVSPGVEVAEIYSSAPYEIRLPLSLDDWALVGRDGEGTARGEVIFRAEAGIDTHNWQGRIVRNEGEVERDSRSVYVVAEIDGKEAESLLQPGLFLQARIAGKELPRVARVPFRAFVDLERVAVVDAKNQLRVREVKVLRRAGDEALVISGLEDGERVCLTQLAEMVEGMAVDPKLIEAAPSPTGDLEWTASKP
jgi:multidrug efflux system membrane fusion protein